MAQHLDLEEQEQLDELKHFWKQYGNLVSWTLIAVFSIFAGWNGYQYWQRSQSEQAASLFEEVERIAEVGDPAKSERVFLEIRDRFGSTIYAQQAGLLVAKVVYESGNVEASKRLLLWVSENGSDAGYADTARIRLAGLFTDQKDYEGALRVLSKVLSPEFLALAADRRGDTYALQEKLDDAVKAYQDAYTQLGDRVDYRRLVEIKLNALGVSPKGDSK
jgi:predicted negative regulator of RcsB-dependent stress response